ncbi:hypothetical protein pb186bvf_013404 [Paramecium bursaria]
MDQERKFLLLKKRLDALHYCYPVSLDSSALVEKLLNDLVKTTEGFQQLKKQLEDTKINSAKHEQVLVPLKKENQRLVNENNQLHMAIIQVKEECEQKDTKWRTQVKMLEGERNDWKFMLNQKNIQEKKIQDELLKKQDQNLNPNQPLKLLEQLQESEKKLLAMQQELRDAESKRIIAEEKSKHYELQIDNREKEILRLKSKLDLNGTNIDKLTIDYQLEEAEKRVNRLQTQLDLLTEENTKLNHQLNDYKRDAERHSKKKKVVSSPQKSAKKDEISGIKSKISSIEQELDLKNKELQTQQSQYQAQIQQFNEYVQELQEQNQELRAKASKAEQVIAAYQSDKSAFSRSLSELKNDKDIHNYQLKQLQDKNNELERNLFKAEETIQTFQHQQMQYQREKEIHDRNSYKLHDEMEQKREQLAQLSEQVKQQEKEIDNQVYQNRELKAELQRVEVQKQNLDKLLTSMKQDQGQTRSSAESTNLFKVKLEQQLEGLKRENELIQQERITTENLYRQSKRETAEKDREIQDLKYQKKHLNDQLHDLTNQNATIDAQLNVQIQECAKHEIELNELKRDLARSRIDNKQYQEYKYKVESEATLEIKSLQQQNNLIQQENRDNRLYCTQLEEKVRQLQDMLDQQKLENIRLQDELKDFGDHNIRVQQNILKSKDKESEYIQLISELEKLRERERKLIIDNERCTNELQRYESQNNQLNKQMEFINKQKEEAMREARDLRSMINQVKSSDHDNKNTSIKLTEKMNSYEIALTDTKELYQREQQKVHKLHSELTDALSQLSQLKIQKTDLENQIKQFKTLCDGLEKSREELLQRLQSKNSNKIDDEQLLIRLKDQVSQLDQQNKILNEQQQQSKKIIEQLDIERDEIQNQLDEKLEMNAELQLQIRLLNDEVQRQQSKLNEYNSSKDRNVDTVQQLEQTLRDTMFKSQKQVNDIENLKYTLQMKEKDFLDLKSDIQTLAKENQSLNNQVVKLSQEREITHQQMGYLQQQDLRMKEQIKLMEMEMIDLQQNYTDVCADNQRLSSSLQQLSLQHQDFMMKAQELEKEEEFFKSQVKTFGKKEDQYQSTLMNYQREIQNLNRKLEEQDRQLRELIREREQLSKEVVTNKRLSTGFQQNQEDINRQFAQLEREKLFISETNRELQKQLDLKDAQLTWEQKKVADMEYVLAEERRNQMKSMEDIQMLRNQNEQILQELEIMGTQGQRDSQYRNSKSFESSAQKDNSYQESSKEWNRLKFESELFKKQLSQAAQSSQFLKQKMKSLQQEYEGVLPKH